jgi:hypothetical protein
MVLDLVHWFLCALIYLSKDLAGAAKTQLGLAHRTVRWCTGQCPVRQASFRRTGRSREFLAAYSYNSPDCSVNQRPPAQRSAAKSAGDAWPAPTVGRGHWTVRCANCQKFATVGCARNGKKSRTGHEQWMSGGTPDCPVRHPTEGNFGLPRMPPTAPSCLGAIKETPRHMEETPKHSLIIPKHPDSTPTHLILCASNLSSS